MPQLEVATYSAQIFWLVICLMAIYTGLRYIFIPKLEKSMDSRRAKIQKMLHEAEKLRYEAKILDQKYSEEIKNSHNETFRIYKDAMKELEEELSKELKNLSEEQDKKIDIFRKEIAEIEKNLREEIEIESRKIFDTLLEKFNDKKEK